MPFLSEKLWQTLFNNNKFLILEKNEIFNTPKDYSLSEEKIKTVINIITSVRNLRSELNIPYKKEINLYFDVKDKTIVNFLNNFENEIKRLLKINKIDYQNIKNKDKTAYIVLSDLSILIPLEGIVDTNKEIQKLNSKKENENKKLISIENKLNNDIFMNKAPKHVIDDFKIQLNDLKSSIEKIDQIINTIN